MRFLNRSAGRISRHRRGPLAGFLVIVLGLLLSGGLFAAFAPANADQQESDAAQVAAGRQLFLVGCAFCHGQNGEGILTEDGTQQIGPSLVGVGAAAAHFQLGTGRMPLAQPGPQGPPKKVVYSEEEILQLAAYVASLGPGPAIPDESEFSSEGMSDEEKEEAIANGGQIFLTNCTACHNFGGNGGAMPEGKIAYPLTDTAPIHIFEAMLTGPGQMDVFSNGNLSPEEKRDVILYLQSIKESPEYGGLGLGGLGPVTEGMAAWLIGIGGLVGFAVWIAAHTTRSSKTKNEEASA
ncbi:putative ubiquinol-cytochrome c reductase cytochrome c subunit [metagenome]|uniref:Cytochrome bc1 complex cytochrome c subunit n=1 Tax=metagenome TaxID=256318 RepID=A0A2P2BW25_9ZZZZ